jgi:hypothetical protein
MVHVFVSDRGAQVGCAAKGTNRSVSSRFITLLESLNSGVQSFIWFIQQTGTLPTAWKVRLLVR